MSSKLTKNIALGTVWLILVGLCWILLNHKFTPSNGLAKTTDRRLKHATIEGLTGTSFRLLVTETVGLKVGINA